MSKGNATYLFRGSLDHYHHSESFWTSMFAISLLLGSRATNGIHLPAFEYKRKENEGWFERNGSLEVVEPLEWSQLVVEGKVRTGFLPNLQEAPPQDLWDLKPDIVIRRDNRVTLIEVKTVGHRLGEYQKVCCENVAAYLRRNGYAVELFFLMSAGHESRRDWELLLSVSPEAHQFRLLLWEKVLQVLSQTESTARIMEAIPDLAQYIYPEEQYMRWKES
jgi:hypothetical protein